MPLKPEYFPNERVDLDDFTQSSRGYTDDKTAFDTIKQFLGNKARLLEGFRIEIPDQDPFAGQFTIHNGTALDKIGRPLNNEDQVNDSRTEKLLGGPTTFFVEIEFFQDPTAQDSRAFWDPTFPNTAPDIDGKEFSIPTKTRLSPDWRIVTPFNTVGFEADRDEPASFVLNTNRIPIAQLTTDGAGKIVLQGGIVPVVVSGTLEEDAGSGDTFIRLLNSRLFPVTVGPATSIDIGFGSQDVPSITETLTISDNDRVNGVISLGAGLANDHKAGEIVRIVGATTSFIPQRTEPIPDLSGTTHPDPTRKQFQGNERRGRALISSKETEGNRDDLNIETLKDEIDALSSLIHEMKFGSRRPDELGTLDDNHFDRLPPHVVTAPRYWDMAGSIMGVRTATLTVGDGVTTFGDFNGTDHNPFQDAVDNLPTAGGTIFIKGGVYTFTTEIVYADKSVVWVGESKDLVTLSFSSGGQSMFQITNPSAFTLSTVFRDLTITKSGSNQRAIKLTDIVDTLIERCVITGEVNTVNPVAVDAKLTILDSRVTALDAADRRAVRAEDLKDIVVDNSFITGEFHVISPVLVHKFNARNSTFIAAPVANTSAIRIGGAILFDALNCTISASGSIADQRVVRFEDFIGGLINNCVMVTRDGALFEFDDDVSSFAIKNTRLITTFGGALINSTDTSAVWTNFSMEGIEITNPVGVALNINYDEYMLFGTLSGCSFRDIRVVDPLVASAPTDSFIRWGDADSATLINQVLFEKISVSFEGTSGGIGLNCPGDDTHIGQYAVSVAGCSFVGCSKAVVCRKPGTLLVDDCIVDGFAAVGIGGVLQCSAGVVCGPRKNNTNQDITVRDSIFKRVIDTSEDSAFGVQLIGPAGTVPPAVPPADMFANLTVKDNVFSEIGNVSISGTGIVAGVFTDDDTRMANIVITGNEFDRLGANDEPGTILRSVLIRGFQPSIPPAASESIHIHNNNFHDQGSISSLDNGFVEVDRTVEVLIIAACNIHDNNFALLNGIGLGLFAVKLDAEVISRVAVCRNHFATIGQSSTDDSEASGVIYLTAAVMQGIQISENNILQNGSVSSIPAIRIAVGTLSDDITVSNNNIVCGSRTWRPIYISGAALLVGTTVAGNTINKLSQVWSAKLDSGILVTALAPRSTIISNNNIKEDTFLDIRSAITLESTSFGDDAVVSGNVVRMPDPGVGNTRLSVIRLQAILNHVVSNNMVRAVTTPTPLGSSIGILIAGLSDGLVVGNYVLPGLDGIVIDMSAAGDDSVALSNVVGTSTDVGSIAITAPTFRAKQGNLVSLGFTNVNDVNV